VALKPKGTSRAGASEAKPIKARNGEKVAVVRSGGPASRLIDQRIRDLGGWRGETLARMRALILEADPEMTEEWKWMDVESSKGAMRVGGTLR
jgi:hypothetical protein